MLKIEGFRAGTVLYQDTETNFLFKLNKVGENNTKYYKCYQDSCNVRISEKVSGERDTRQNSHSHPADLGQLRHLEFLTQLRHLAATTNDTYKEIFRRCRENNDEGAGFVGLFHQNASIMYKARTGTTKALPKNLKDFANKMEDPE